MLIFIPTKWKEGGKKGYKDKSFFYLYTACKLNRFLINNILIIYTCKTLLFLNKIFFPSLYLVFAY